MTTSSDACDEVSAAFASLDDDTDAMEDVWHDRPPVVARLVERAEAAE